MLVIPRIMIIPERDYHCSLPCVQAASISIRYVALVASTLLSETPVVSRRLSLYRERVKVTVSRRDASSNPRRRLRFRRAAGSGKSAAVLDAASKSADKREVDLLSSLRLASVARATTVSASPIARKHRARVPVGERTPTNFPKEYTKLPCNCYMIFLRPADCVSHVEQPSSETRRVVCCALRTSERSERIAPTSDIGFV